MTPKILGAVLIITACGGMGFSQAANHRRKEQMLRQMMTTVKFMICELQYRQPALPNLIDLAAEETSGIIRQILRAMAQELDRQIAPDAPCCMQVVLGDYTKLPQMIMQKLELLGRTLGRFDLHGQLAGLEAVYQLCQRDLDGLLLNRDDRLRSYGTLGLCAGAALVILFI